MFILCVHVIFQLRSLDPKVQCGLCVYCNSLMETVDGYKRTAWWADLLSPLVDWVYFQSLKSFLLDYVGVKLVLFCKDDILTNRHDSTYSVLPPSLPPSLSLSSYKTSLSPSLLPSLYISMHARAVPIMHLQTCIL